MSIQLIDCTLRDGGNLNQWQFSDMSIRQIIEGLDRARTDYIELGYLGGSGSNPSKQAGKTFDCTPEFLDELPQTSHAKKAIMVVPSVCSLEQLLKLNPNTVSLVRVASYPQDIAYAMPYIEALKKRGFQAAMNLMAASYTEPVQAAQIAVEAARHGADVFYIADSFGSMTPGSVREYISVLKQSTDCDVGFHGHNNLGLAFANALEAVRAGAVFVDTSLCGMARGAGNLPTEQWISAMTHWGGFSTDFDVLSIIETAEYVLHNVLEKPMRIAAPEMICGLHNIHYYYYDKIMDSRSEMQLKSAWKIAQSLGKMRPPKVDAAYLNKAMELTGGMNNES
ncbi:aldolase [Paenibacillus sp. AN1007]|uniref:Aldolase n=1 Tax=Paenibacillus sp. AN1007 TaxID=3151385 RepID=A0AAU8NGF2_9BACL